MDSEHQLVPSDRRNGGWAAGKIGVRWADAKHQTDTLAGNWSTVALWPLQRCVSRDWRWATGLRNLKPLNEARPGI